MSHINRTGFFSENKHVSGVVWHMPVSDTNATLAHVVTFNHFYFLNLLPVSTCRYRVVSGVRVYFSASYILVCQTAYNWSVRCCVLTFRCCHVCPHGEPIWSFDGKRRETKNLEQMDAKKKIDVFLSSKLS